jgi:hypothetical protein
LGKIQVPIIIYKHPVHPATNAIRVFNATIKALADDKTIEFDSQEPQFRFAQDMCLVLDKEKVLIFPNNPKIPANLQDDIKNYFEEQEYEVLRINSYFEGGNIIRVNNTIFHGNYPVGDYVGSGPGSEEVREYNEFIAEMRTIASHNPKLENLRFEELNLGSEFQPGIEFAKQWPVYDGKFRLYLPEEKHRNEVLNSTTYKVFSAWRQFYYHLDCFLSVSPEGKLFILNEKILSDISLSKLREAAGSEVELINFAYESYLDSPIILNLAFFKGMQGDIRVVAPDFTGDMLALIKNHYRFVITPAVIKENKALQNMIRDCAEGEVDFNELEDFIVNAGGPHCMSLSFLHAKHSLHQQLPFCSSSSDAEDSGDEAEDSAAPDHP